MDAIEKRARKLVMDEIPNLAEECFGYQVMTVVNLHVVMRTLRAALTPPEGHVVVTRNEAGQAVAVTRQDDEGRILSVIAEFEVPEGYVLVPVEMTKEIEGVLNESVEFDYSAESTWDLAIHASGKFENVND